MKKFLFFGMIGAIALTFNACSSDDVVENPTFDGKSVKTEFALNLPGKIGTRMQEAITQGDASFRGLDADRFFLFAMNAATAADDDPVLENTPLLTNIELDAFSEFDHENAQDHWYTDIEVPVGTNAFLVYAAADPAEGEAANGVLNMVLDEEAAPQSMTFELQNITDELSLAEEGGFLLEALNGLRTVEGKANANATEAKAWNEMTADEDNQYYADLYETFTSLTAGSKTSVLAFLDDLKAACAVPTGVEDGIDVALAAAIDEAIAAIEAGDDFTRDNNIPDGAAVLKINEDGAFEFVETEHITGYAWGVNDYAYPAELWYRVNTGIRVDKERQAENVGDQTWGEFIESAYDADNNAVQANSQSIALVNPLQYAVGNFETQIKFGNENMLKTYVYEYTQPIDDETGEPAVDANGDPVLIPSGEKVEETVPVSALQLTGILVGDQKAIDWEAHTLTDAAPVVVYDTDLIANTFGTAFDVASQTLVLETAQESVNVALEFQNNSEVDFTGVNECIIPAGTKFYLIGQLKIGQDDHNWVANGDAEQIFQQDYKTIAKFTINTLENNAYNVVPDLRIPELEFGLSVDLEWQEGYTFEIEIPAGE